ncbi:hypothetical protein TVAG_151490 [Trichomonas vaginalis G3]|uniref:Uncharacterized protein n=1 Tax=Trichomonas vaginalis (strain ATCC PRA-98 / G3) TaxID=412133 RepID=A2G6Q8_TRIV3|nr:hypothetical protein TVAGG3_0744670 [Trichomonas vaginalis G3]EAX87158.1 hypothetical protein TVAG_151490 [Trichomonas vaginalis G3]KAI5512082.1 hypothetical protein TVAGG3_0744670 [Trichomonas vaginalis G3]|eukprot:XP_001300088.1 hypothetical protein [Trichomonas vaginalis G3]
MAEEEGFVRPVKPPQPKFENQNMSISNPRKKYLTRSSENFFSPKKEEVLSSSSEEDEDMDFKFELNELEKKYNVYPSSDEDNENEEEEVDRLLQLRREYTRLVSELKEQKQKISAQNQTKLNADVKYMREMIFFMNKSIDHQISQTNLNKGILNQMKQPNDYSIKLNEISKQSVKIFSLAYEQIDLLRGIIERSSNKSFVENVNIVLSEKEDELQKLQEQKEELAAELADLKEKFTAQSEFIQKQKFKRETSKFEEQLMKDYRENLQNIRDFSNLALTEIVTPPSFAKRSAPTTRKSTAKPIISFPKVGQQNKIRNVSLPPFTKLQGFGANMDDPDSYSDE